MMRIKLGLVGVGKIARDQHLPVIAASANFELVAVASRNHAVDGVPTYPSLAAMLDAEPAIEAVSLCAPPGPRDADARLALSRLVSVLLEKPPAASLEAAREIVSRAQDVALYASWHSRHAPAVEPAREWLQDRRVRHIRIIWREDIRRWHPGQDWILEAAGMGVFDPAINALSIVTHILPTEMVLRGAELDIPSNREAPIAARLEASTSDGAQIVADLSFLEPGEARWEIDIETDRGLLRLIKGGARAFVGDADLPAKSLGRHHEYAGVYALFAELVRTRRIEADLRPLQLVSEALSIGVRRQVAPFAF